MRVLITLLFSICCFPAAAADDAFVVRNAWVREAPPGAEVLAAYFEIENRTAAGRQLIAASSKDAERIEIHTVTLHDGVARMSPIPALALPPGRVVALKPGGYHLMLHKPRRALTEGTTVAIELRFDSGAPLTVQAPVRRAQGPMMHHR